MSKRERYLVISVGDFDVLFGPYLTYQFPGHQRQSAAAAAWCAVRVTLGAAGAKADRECELRSSGGGGGRGALR